MIAITRRVNFCAGHRLLGHEGRCAHFHGHNYTANFTVVPESGTQLDAVGRVVDFAVLKERLAGWIDEHWDHAFIVWEKDEEAISALNVLRKQRIFLLPENPTAENLANYLLLRMAPSALQGTGVRAIRVQVIETENCSAEVSLDG